MIDNSQYYLDLRGVALGAPAAERDIHVGLEHYFIKSEAYRRVSSRSKTVVLGNRGAGKSAIFQMLARDARKRNSLVIELAPEDYSYELLSSALRSESEGSWAKLGAYAVAWKYLIYVLLMKEMVARGGGRPGRGPLAKITAYIRDNHPTSDLSKLSGLIGYLKRLEGVKIGPAEVRVKAKELERLYKLEEIDSLYPAIQEMLLKQPALVFVDELDRGWDASEDAKAFVAGLFQACMGINSLSQNLTVYMSLRQELYDNIPALYEDAQKYRDVIEKISWNEDGLRDLIAARLRHALPKLQRMNSHAVWDHVFAETLTYRRNKSFNYMIDRTLYRPREFIQFCSEAIQESVRTGVAPPLDYAVISRAEWTHSEERTKDIAAEFRFQYPGLLSVFDAFRGGTYGLDREELLQICLEIVTGGVAMDPATNTWVCHLEPEVLVEILWQVGFLRARAAGGIKGERRSGSSYLGPHQVGRLNFSDISHFQIHQMFRTYLGLRESKTSPATGSGTTSSL